MEDAALAPITLRLTTPQRMRAGRVSVWTFEIADLPPGPFRLTARSRLLAEPIEAILTAGVCVHAEARMRRETGEGVVEFTLESSAAAGERRLWIGHAPIDLAPAGRPGSIDIAPTLTVAEGAMAIEPSLAIHLPRSEQGPPIRIAPRWDLAEWGVVDRPSLRVSFEEGDGRDGQDGLTRTVTLRPADGAQRRASEQRAKGQLPERMPGCLAVRTPHRLLLRTSSKPDGVFRALLGDRLTIGRDPGCDVCLASPDSEADLHRLSHLSGVAAEIRLEGVSASVRSLNRNGARLDGEPLGASWKRLWARHAVQFPVPGRPCEVQIESSGDQALRVITPEGHVHALWRGELDLEWALGGEETPGPPAALLHREDHVWLHPTAGGEARVRTRRATCRVGAAARIALPRHWRAEGEDWWLEGRMA